MTIDSAAMRWNVKASTVLDYIHKEYIADITCEGAVLSLPEIPKPYIPRRKNDAIEYPEKTILKACAKNYFIDEHILRCSRVSLEKYLARLVEGGYLRKTDDTQTKGNLGYQCTEAGSEVVNSNRSLNLPDINVNVSLVGGVSCIGQV